jgi:hypothetical protein
MTVVITSIGNQWVDRENDQSGIEKNSVHEVHQMHSAITKLSNEERFVYASEQMTPHHDQH